MLSHSRSLLIAVAAALAAVALVACSTGSAPTAPGCSAAFAGGRFWIDPAVVDPRPPPLNDHQPTPTFLLSIGFTGLNGGPDPILTANSTGLVASSGYTLPFEGGPSMGSHECLVDPDSFTGEVRYLGASQGVPNRMEAVTAQLVGDRLVGTITIEGYVTTFDAAPR